jgi:hypothetical protein
MQDVNDRLASRTKINTVSRMEDRLEILEIVLSFLLQTSNPSIRKREESSSWLKAPTKLALYRLQIGYK